MLSAAAEILLLAAALAVLLYQGAALLFAAQMPRLDPAPPATTVGPVPKVSVVIAARNEEVDLPTTLDALAVQEYPNLEVVVVEGGSTDRTPEVLAARAGRVRPVAEPPLPPGWVGKNWACWTGAEATDGEWLLFLDADVRLAPSAVGTVLAWAEREEAALATIAPRVEMLGPWERTVLPFYIQMVLTHLRAPHVNRARSRAALVNGQFWLVRRAEYAALGGHAGVRDQLVEDVAIGRRFRAAGRRIRLAWAPALATTRMYRDRREMYEGVLRTVGGTEFSAAREAGYLAGLVGFFWLPLGLLPFGLAVGSPLLAGVGAFLYFALFGKHVAFARAVGAPAAYGLLFPIAVGFYATAVATLLLRGIRGGAVTWKGRSYPLRP